jgi:hypothetical protein
MDHFGGLQQCRYAFLDGQPRDGHHDLATVKTQR